MQEGVPLDQSTSKSETLVDSLIPGKAIVKTVTGAVGQVIPLVEKMDTTVALLSQKMGDGMQLSESIKQNLSVGADKVIELGGSFEKAAKLQEDFSEVFGRNIILQGEQYDELYATAQVTGVEAKTLMDSFADVGVATKNITKEMRTVVEVSNSLGVNAQAVSSRVTSNLDKLNRFGFQGGVEGLARMAAQSAVLRTNMDQVFNIADDLMSPEKAIEMSSALQRLGAASTSLVDPLKLMDLAQNDVGELQNQLGQLFKQYTTFDEKSQKFQIMPSARRDLKAIAQELGMSVSEVEKFALGTADIEKKLSEISFSGMEFDEDTQNMIANMATMGEGGTYEITTKDEGTVSLQDFLKKYQGREDELKEYLQSEAELAAQTNEEKMLAKADAQLGVLGEINAKINQAKFAPGLSVAGSQVGEEILSLAQKNVQIQIEDFIKNFGPASKTFTDGLNKLAVDLQTARETGDFSAGVTAFKGFGEMILTQATETAQGIVKKYGEAVGVDIDLSGIKNAITSAVESLTSGAQSISGAFNTVKGVLESAFSGLGGIVDTIKEKVGIDDGEINIAGGTNLVAYDEGTIQPIETAVGDKIMVYKNEPKPEKEYLGEQLSKIGKETTPKPTQNYGDEINNTLSQIVNNVNNTNNTLTTTATQNNQQFTETANNVFETLNQVVQKISEQKEPSFNITIPKSEVIANKTEDTVTNRETLTKIDESNKTNETISQAVQKISEKDLTKIDQSNKTNETISQAVQKISEKDLTKIDESNKTNETISQAVQKISEKDLTKIEQETQIIRPQEIQIQNSMENKFEKNEIYKEDLMKQVMSQTTNTKNENVVSGGLDVNLNHTVTINGTGINTLTAQQLEPILTKMLREDNKTQQAVTEAIKNAGLGRNSSSTKEITYST